MVSAGDVVEVAKIVDMVLWVASAVMDVAGMTSAARGYEVKGGDVDDGGVVVVRGMVMMMTVVAGCGCRRGVEARGGEWIWGSGRSGHEDNIWFRPERSPKNFSGGGGMVAGDGRPAGRVAGNFWERERDSGGVCVLIFDKMKFL
ncbi:hypothetical protein Tco_1159340 [Tanacetum coccineum]